MFHVRAFAKEDFYKLTTGCSRGDLEFGQEGFNRLEMSRHCAF